MDPKLIISTPLGKIRGARVITDSTKATYYKFCGIPYAQPPLDLLRFLPPKRAEKWPRILDGTTERDSCLQFSAFSLQILGSEDCLYLNVFTPELPSATTKLKPVIVQVHPGGHLWGSASKQNTGDPDYFMHKDVIFVNFNYRLHVFGFLNLDLPKCSGNMGLKDQQLAFQWVKTNITYFGGDPDNITLYGNSSGSSDVHLHMMNPTSQKLFHRVIMQCGYALNPCWTYQEKHVERAIEFGQYMGFKGDNRKKLLNFFRQQNSLVLLQAMLGFRKNLLQRNQARYETCVFLPSIEISQDDAFITRSPRELIHLTPPKPMICSITSKEGSLAFCADPLSMLNEIFPIIVRENLWMYKMPNETLDYVCRELRNFYFGNVCKINDSMITEITDFYSDLWYSEWHSWIDWNSKFVPVYLYYFDYDGQLANNMIKKRSQQSITGPWHADDGAYFMMYKSWKYNPRSFKFNPTDRMIIDNMTTLFTNFAKTGNPNGGTTPEIKWYPHTINDPSYLIFEADGLRILKKTIYEKRKLFWNKIIEYIKDHENDVD